MKSGIDRLLVVALVVTVLSAWFISFELTARLCEGFLPISVLDVVMLVLAWITTFVIWSLTYGSKPKIRHSWSGDFVCTTCGIRFNHPGHCWKCFIDGKPSEIIKRRSVESKK